MGRNLPFFPVYHHRGKLSISNFAEAQKTPLRRQKQRGQGKEDYWFFTESWGANKDLGEAPKSCTRKEHESATNSIARRGQGAIAPCRVKGQRPLWGLGQRPNCFSSDQPQRTSQQGAGSEASLPQTSRVRRRAPNSLYPLLAHCRAKWARPNRNRVSSHHQPLTPFFVSITQCPHPPRHPIPQLLRRPNRHPSPHHPNRRHPPFAQSR